MSKQSQQLWNEFKIFFKKEIEELAETQLKHLREISQRKHVFNDYVLNNVATAMNLKMRPEFLRVDYTFMATGKNGWQVPVVCIESENNFESCYEESLKLCAINAPLKILIIYGMPEQRGQDFIKNDINDAYIFADFIEKTQLTGWYSIMAYDDTADEIRFHIFVYDGNGAKIESDVMHIRTKNLHQ